jgi:hypothetical protein
MYGTFTIEEKKDLLNILDSLKYLNVLIYEREAYKSEINVTTATIILLFFDKYKSIEAIDAKAKFISQVYRKIKVQSVTRCKNDLFRFCPHNTSNNIKLKNKRE